MVPMNNGETDNDDVENSKKAKKVWCFTLMMIVKNLVLIGNSSCIVKNEAQRIFVCGSGATEPTAQLGCTPCTLAVGVGRSH